MATVYLADDLRHERKVALKVLKPELAAVVGADRFLAEIKTTANLQHGEAQRPAELALAATQLWLVRLGALRLVAMRVLTAEFRVRYVACG